MKGYTLGLDLGPTSIGWAMIADEPEEGGQNIIAGVRVFPEGVLRPKGEWEESKSAGRRTARLMRRQHDRKGRRKKTLAFILRGAGLLPPPGPEMDALFARSPYELRRRGLDEDLTLHEFGRALLHLNQRRGFKSSRKQAKTKEDGIVSQGITKLASDMQAEGADTLGVFYARREGKMVLRRRKDSQHGWFAGREMVKKEFDRLWTRQAQAYPAVLTEELRDEVDEELFRQRPLKEPHLAKCELEPEEDRCHRASWYAQRFRLLQDVNNLRILSGRGAERALEPAQRAGLLERLSVRRKMTVKAVRKFLELGESETLNFEGGKRDEFLGNAAEAGLRDIFKQRFEADRVFCIETVYESLVEEDEHEWERRARGEWGLTEEEIKALFELVASQSDGRGQLSRKAIQRLLPYMEEGLEPT
ncbi:MAG: hypothetical protein NTW86_13105, partial [Candidatus Sumerlaeota bacterium]|nr:hypothetical protein [Candidatus Sumerlaeota bacterium]